MKSSLGVFGKYILVTVFGTMHTSCGENCRRWNDEVYTTTYNSSMT